MLTVAQILAKCRGRRLADESLKTLCPAHDDKQPSLTWKLADGKWLAHCHAGCRIEDIVSAMGFGIADLFDDSATAPKNGRPARIALADLAAHKRIPIEFLRSLGLHDLEGGAGVGVPYRSAAGEVVKSRTALTAGQGSFWPKGRPLMPYGLDRLVDAREQKTLILVEGESDCWALWYHGFQALGVPGAASTRVLERAHLDGVATVYVHQEPDEGGRKFVDGVKARVKALGWSGSLHVVKLDGAKDPSELHARDPGGFKEKFAAALKAACETPLHGSAPVLAPAPADSAQNAAPKDGSVGRKSLPFRTAAEIAATDSAIVPWVACPWVAEHSLTEVDGPAKLSGKTTLVMSLVASALDGREFLDYPTSKTPVVYLTEERGPTLRKALKRAGVQDRNDLHLLSWGEAAGVAWPEIVAAAVERCKSAGAKLLIVDTLPQFAQLVGDDENSAGRALEALAPLQAAAAGGLAVLFTRHERKGGGQVGEAARGSSAFGGAVDVILSLRRPDGAAPPTRRIIRTLSRFDETPSTLIVDKTDDGYVSRGDEETSAVEDSRAALAEELPDNEGDALSLTELAVRAGTTRSAAQRAVDALVEQGKARKIGAGKRGNPYRYWTHPEGARAETGQNPVALPSDEKDSARQLGWAESWAEKSRVIPLDSISARLGGNPRGNEGEQNPDRTPPGPPDSARAESEQHLGRNQEADRDRGEL